MRLEAAGTSRIEGAEFSDREQEIALASEVPDLDLTRRNASARRSRVRSDRLPDWCWTSRPAAMTTTRTGRGPTDWNVRPRAAAVTEDANQTAIGFCAAIAGEFQQHDRIIQALAAHYHIGAMHPSATATGAPLAPWKPSC